MLYFRSRSCQNPGHLNLKKMINLIETTNYNKNKVKLIIKYIVDAKKLHQNNNKRLMSG